MLLIKQAADWIMGSSKTTAGGDVKVKYIMDVLRSMYMEHK